MSPFVRIRNHAGRRLALLAVTVALTALAAVITATVASAFRDTPSSRQASARTDRAVGSPTPDQLATVKTIAEGLANSNGGGLPSKIDVVATDRKAAELLDTGATVNSDESCGVR